MNVRTWVHTCAGRKDKLGPTLESLDASDLKGKYEILESPMGDVKLCNEWWKETMLRLASEPIDGAPPDLVMRLEDDVIVNEHILYNVSHWPAVTHKDFGTGWIFIWDGQWPPRPCMQRWKFDGSMICLDLDLAGAQGQVFDAKFVPKLVGQISNAQRWHPPLQLIYDPVVSRATQLAGKFVYMHRPALVNCHWGCIESATGYKHHGHFSNKNYDATWRRGRDPEPRRL